MSEHTVGRWYTKQQERFLLWQVWSKTPEGQDICIAVDLHPGNAEHIVRCVNAVQDGLVSVTVKS